MNIAPYIDHTLLKPTATIADIEKLCKEAVEYQFAAVCVPPIYIKKAKEFIGSSPVKIATVAGFPLGYAAIEAKIAEVILAVVDGVDEIDLVINITAIKNGDWAYVANELNTVLPVIRNNNKLVKIIIESGVLTKDEIIKCCDLYGIAGVDFLKTSTGYAETGATLEAVELMRKHLPDSIRIKASGGIRTYAFAKDLINAGAARIGSSNSIAIIKESAS